MNVSFSKNMLHKLKIMLCIAKLHNFLNVNINVAMQNTYHIPTIVMDSGERFPVLVNQDGKPDFSTAVYSVSLLRARNLASATIENSLRAILVLKLFLDGHGIDLKARFAEGVVLHLHELNCLIRVCRLHAKDIPAFFSRGVREGAGSDQSLYFTSNGL